MTTIERIRRGEPFERVAIRNSILGLLPPDGDMGFVAPGALPDPLDAGLRTLAAGEVGGPYARREGWFVMKVSERRPREQPGYESVRNDMVSIASRRKFSASYERAYSSLKEAYEVTLVPGGGAAPVPHRLAAGAAPAHGRAAPPAARHLARRRLHAGRRARRPVATRRAGARHEPASGEAVYKKTCIGCHASGADNAPKLGDKVAWKPRIAKGMDALLKSAINGVPGTAMMKRGTCASCSDDDLKAAVEYMESQSK